jgi:CheY-like chemotaxis protein
MKILFLEDNGEVLSRVQILLEDQGHQIVRAYNILDAEDKLLEEGEFDAWIVDLFLPMDGLAHDQMEESEGGILTGWVWLLRKGIKNNLNLKKTVLILSAYVKELEKKLEEDKSLFRSLKTFSKLNANHQKDLINELARMEKQN